MQIRAFIACIVHLINCILRPSATIIGTSIRFTLFNEAPIKSALSWGPYPQLFLQHHLDNHHRWVTTNKSSSCTSLFKLPASEFSLHTDMVYIAHICSFEWGILLGWFQEQPPHYLTQVVFLNPSCGIFWAYFHVLPYSVWDTSIGTTSHEHDHAFFFSWLRKEQNIFL